MATQGDLARGWVQKGDSDQPTAQQALAVVDRVRCAVLGVLPPEVEP